MNVNNINIEELEKLYKFLALIISDRTSSELKVNFDIKDVNCKEEPYLNLVRKVPEFSFIGLYKYLTRGIVISIDAAIIFSLANRMLGGDGKPEKERDNVFTNSEKMLGNRVMELFTTIFKKYNLEVEFLRLEQHIDYVHYFYPDEIISSVEINSKINGEFMGQIFACHPITFEKEKF